MQKTYELQPSLAQRTLLLTGHGLIGAAIYFYFEPSLLMLAALAVICLLAIGESRGLIQRGKIKLHLDPDNKSIEYKQGEQPQFYRKYKVHQTRWFAILRLIDTDKTRTLILNPDCFSSLESYRQLRYQLRKMEQPDAA